MNQKYWWIIIVILAIIVVGVWVWRLGSSHVSPTEPTGAAATSTAPAAGTSTTVPGLGADTTGDIRQQLQGINPGGVNNELNQVNQDLNNL